jgi:CheY-like chemotaxis protein
MNRNAHSLSMAEELRLVDEETALHVLLAEPNAELRRLMAFVLRREGHAVVTVKDGSQLLEALARGLIDRGHRPFDLIICNQKVPGIPGLSVLAGLRARDRTTGFILITEDTVVQSNAQRLGAVVLDRPLTVDGIRGAIFRTGRLSPALPDLRAVS